MDSRSSTVRPSLAEMATLSLEDTSFSAWPSRFWIVASRFLRANKTFSSTGIFWFVLQNRFHTAGKKYRNDSFMSSHGLGNNVVASNVASFLNNQGDVLRFAAVCKSWRNTLKSSPMHRFKNLVFVKKEMQRSTLSLMFHSCGDILELFSDFILRRKISPLQFRYLFKHARKIKFYSVSITP